MEFALTALALYSIGATFTALLFWRASTRQTRMIDGMERYIKVQDDEISRLNMENVHYEGLFGPRTRE